VLGVFAALLAFWGTISILKGIFHLRNYEILLNKIARNLRLRHARVQSEIEGVHFDFFFKKYS